MCPRKPLALPHSMVSDPEAFCLRVNSDSMRGEVEKGDLVVVSPALCSSIKDGDLVVARTDHGALLKRFLRADGCAILISSNPSYPPVILDAAHSATIIGKVIYAIRYYK